MLTAEWNIVNYMRHLPPKGSLDVPTVYKEAAEEHGEHHARELGEKAQPAASAPEHEHHHKH